MYALLQEQKRQVIERYLQMQITNEDSDLPAIGVNSIALLPPGESDTKFREVANRQVLRGLARGVRMTLHLTDSVAKIDTSNFGFPQDLDVDAFRMTRAMQQATKQILDETYGQQYWQNIGTVTRNKLQRTIQRGLREAMSSKEVAREIEQDKSGIFSRERANRIARTETTGALNGGAWLARQELYKDGIITEEEWLAIKDEDTRSTHFDADGQRKGQLGFFTVGGEQARFPGDPLLSAGERINCRCTAIPIETKNIDDTSPPPELEEEAAPPAPSLADPILPTPTSIPIPKEFEPRMLHLLEHDAGLQKKLDDVLALEKTHVGDVEAVKRSDETIKLFENERKRLMSEFAALKDPEPWRVKQYQEELLNVENTIASEKRVRHLRATRGIKQAAHKAIAPAEPMHFETRLSDTIKKTPSTKEDIEEVESFVRTVMGDDKHNPGRIHSIQYKTQKAFRAHHEGADTVVINKISPRDTIAHEIGHGIEQQHTNAKKAANAFHKHRVKGEQPQRLKDLFPDSGYGASEKGVKDDWEKLFGEQKAYYVGKLYPFSQQTEIISMGLEALWNDPVKMAKLDPEFFKFIVGILDGTIL